MKIRILALIALVAVLGGVIAVKQFNNSSNVSNLGTSDASPAKSSAVLIDQVKEKGMPAWLLFHSTTCQSCVEMQAVFDQLKPEFKEKVAFINIDVNNSAEQALCTEYHIQYIPTTFLLNTKGEIAFEYVGVIPSDEMRTKLSSLAEGR